MALYGCETWTLRLQDRKKLEAFEMWLWRRMERISYTAHTSNVEVLERVGEERKLLTTVWKRKKNWIGHVLRHDSVLKLVIKGRMEGQRGRGWKRIGMLDDLMVDERYAQMKRRAENRDMWKNWIPEPVFGQIA